MILLDRRQFVPAMSLIISGSAIILSIVFHWLFIPVNCEEKDGTQYPQIRVLKADYNSKQFSFEGLIQQNIELEPMNSPENPPRDFSAAEMINVLESDLGFGVLSIPEDLKQTLMFAARLSMDDDGFVVPILTAMYNEFKGVHDDWIVIPSKVQRRGSKQAPSWFAHTDFSRDVDLKFLLTDSSLSFDVVQLLARHPRIRTAALRKYKGDIERFLLDRLTLVYLMNIWVPLRPVESWPLAFKPRSQLEESRIHNCLTSPDPLQLTGPHRFQVLKESNAKTPEKWYTRFDMQFDEMYIWNSSSVVHSAVKIRNGDPRSSFDVRLMIVKANFDFSKSICSGEPAGTLCYSSRLYNQIYKTCFEHHKTLSTLKYLGFPQSCEERLAAVNSEPSLSLLSSTPVSDPDPGSYTIHNNYY